MQLTKKRERTVKTKENKSNEDIITLRRLIDSDKIYLKYDATVIIRTQLSLLNRVTRLILFLQFIQNQQMFANKVLSSTGLTSQEYQKTLATHKTFLNKFKILPQKTRKVTYKQLLMLPNNYGHLQELTKSYLVLPEHGFNRQVALVTDALARLFPELKNQWLPSMIFPFVKLFQEDYTFSFECSLAFLLNWLEPVLYDFPNANKDVMEIFELCLPSLKQKIESLDYPLSSLINPMFVVSLTDVLNKKDWLEIFDFLVTNPFEPWHYISVAITIVYLIEQKLEKLFSVQEMSVALRKQKNIPMSIVIQKAKQISTRHKQKFLAIYKNSIFPIQHDRYPLHKFFRTPMRKTNSKLQVQDDIQMDDIKSKYKHLEAMLQKFINTGHLSDEEAIQNKYQMVEGQVRQYLSLVKQQHANKMKALKQIQYKFNAQLQAQGQNREPKMNVIEKRARLQREIQTVLGEADSIKQMEDDMMKRINESIKIKKNQIRKLNENIRGR